MHTHTTNQVFMKAMARVIEVVQTKPRKPPKPTKKGDEPGSSNKKTAAQGAAAAEGEEADESKEEEGGEWPSRKRKPPASAESASREEVEQRPGPAWVRLRPEAPPAVVAGVASFEPAAATSSSSLRKPSLPSSPTKRAAASASASASTAAEAPPPPLVALPALAAALAERAISLHAADAKAATRTEDREEEEGENGAAFLALGDVLELLSGLAGAFPQAALLLQRTVSQRAGPFATQFLLHAVLPAARHTPAYTVTPSGAPHATPAAHAHLRLVRGAQAAARLLVVLCVRSSEARRRIVAALAAALSGSGAALEEEDRLLWALQAWGELTLALLDPRSNPSRPSHHEATNAAGQQALAWEVVRLMLMPPTDGKPPAATVAAAASSSSSSPVQGTMTEALTQAVRRVPLGDARAPSALSALLRPLEILTRCVSGCWVCLLARARRKARRGGGLDWLCLSLSVVVAGSRIARSPPTPSTNQTTKTHTHEPQQKQNTQARRRRPRARAA
jgi:hypothetical protein